MKVNDVISQVGHYPFISPKNGRLLYDMIIKAGSRDILELGFAHGTATCYMAAAIEELGAGKIVSVDLPASAGFSPNAEELLKMTGLAPWVTLHRPKTGYTWFLHDEIVRHTVENQCSPAFDLCIIDGAKDWTNEGAAFFMADKLLRSGGWMIFDDYSWSFGGDGNREKAATREAFERYSADELATPQIREVFELLVKQHPSYGELVVFEEGDWAMARKVSRDSKSYTIASTVTTRDILARLIRKVWRRGRPKKVQSS